MIFKCIKRFFSADSSELAMLVTKDGVIIPPTRQDVEGRERHRAEILVKTQTNMKRDHLLELRMCLRAYLETEQDFISTNPTLCEAELENHSDSYIWLRLPIPDEHPETVSDMILSGVEELPNECLAGILVAILKNQVPMGVHMRGVSIDRIGSSFHFCISGSTSLEELRTLCERHATSFDFGG